MLSFPRVRRELADADGWGRASITLICCLLPWKFYGRRADGDVEVGRGQGGRLAGGRVFPPLKNLP